MLAVLVIWSIAAATLGLAFYVAHKMRPNSFKLRARVLRVFSFSLEIDSSDSVRETERALERHLEPTAPPRRGSPDLRLPSASAPASPQTTWAGPK